jgi:YgiT-type zinc finger domain-containing protein
MKLKINTCPSCGSQNIKRIRRNLMGKFAQRSYGVPSLEYYECPDCGEKVYDREAMRKIEAVSPAFCKIRTRKIAVG